MGPAAAAVLRDVLVAAHGEEVGAVNVAPGEGGGEVRYLQVTVVVYVEAGVDASGGILFIGPQLSTRLDDGGDCGHEGERDADLSTRNRDGGEDEIMRVGSKIR
jgi:hypothetical protein